MTNEEKALEIARLKSISEFDKYENPFKREIYDRCMEMAEWKDKQLIDKSKLLWWEDEGNDPEDIEGRIKRACVKTAKVCFELDEFDKKQLIDKACEWLYSRQVIDLEVPNIDEFINDFRKAMEGFPVSAARAACMLWQKDKKRGGRKQ